MTINCTSRPDPAPWKEQKEAFTTTINVESKAS